jgi:CubicO group peptidase (beta-lactamase class C family)
MGLSAIRSDLTEHLDKEMARLHVPGVAVGIVHGAEELVVTRGVTSLEHPLEVDATTLFQIGSRTKTFTGTALMRQVEAGKLDLDAPLVHYLPEFSLGNPAYTPRVTPRQLLTHTGGWLGDYFLAVPVRGRGEDALARLVEAMPQPPCLLPPGETFSYNNSGFSIAGRLLEVLTGQPYEEVIRTLVFEPLHLHHSTFFGEDVITERTAVGHIVRNGKPHVARPWGISRSSHPAGGIISDIPDQLRYARFHLGDGTAPDGSRVLAAATLADMQSAYAPALSAGEAVGLPWLLARVGGVRTVGHGGGMNGQISAFILVPDRGFGISVFTNADAGQLLCPELVRWTLERVLAIREKPPTPIPRSAEQLDEYVGEYAFGLVHVAREGDHLVLSRESIPGSELMEEATPPVPLAFFAADGVFELEEPVNGSRGQFLRNADGRVQHLHFGGRLLPRSGEGGTWKDMLGLSSSSPRRTS